MQSRAAVCNSVARALVQDSLHCALVRYSAARRLPSPSASEDTDTSSPDAYSIDVPSLISSASTDSFFRDAPDPDLPSFDRSFSRLTSRASSWADGLDCGVSARSTVPGRRGPRTQDHLQRIGCRRNAVVNRLQKAVSFQAGPRWPAARRFTPELGRQKIGELIELTWNYSPLLSYTIDYEHCVGFLHSQRFRYRVRWRTPLGQAAHVFFNIDVPRLDSERPVTVTYTFEDGKIVHKPHTSNYHHRWLRQLMRA